MSRLHLMALIGIVAVTAASCVALPDAHDESRLVSYTCGQTVVVGRIETEYEAPLCDDEGVCWNSLKTAKLRVQRALVGSRKGATLNVRYGGHGALRSDADFMFVLERLPDSNAYTLTAANTIEGRPRLAQPCIRPEATDAVEDG